MHLAKDHECVMVAKIILARIECECGEASYNVLCTRVEQDAYGKNTGSNKKKCISLLVLINTKEMHPFCLLNGDSYFKCCALQVSSLVLDGQWV